MSSSSSSAHSSVLEAYNLFVSESVLIIDSSLTLSTQIPCGVQMNPQADNMQKAADEARKTALDTFGPERPSLAILFEDSKSDRGQQVEKYLLQKHCKSVIRVDREEFKSRYSFLFEPQDSYIPYPNEILPGLFLGGEITASKESILALNISHVVTCMERKIELPDGVDCLWCSILDDPSASIEGIIRKALPFVEDAIRKNKRVLVHCEQGVSRSVSVVVAYLMKSKSIPADEAVRTVKSFRPVARPNPGFMAQLRQLKF